MVVDPMNEKYLDDEDFVYFNIESKIGVNNEIMLPLTLVKDLQKHISEFSGVVTYPINSVVFNALCVYMDYINAELVPFDSVKPDIERCMELDIQEMAIENSGE